MLQKLDNILPVSMQNVTELIFHGTGNCIPGRKSDSVQLCRHRRDFLLDAITFS